MLGFVFALVAGFVAPSLDAAASRPLARALGSLVRVEESEVRALSVLIALLGAGALCAIFNTGSVLGVIVGATLGYFLLRLTSAARDAIENRG